MQYNYHLTTFSNSLNTFKSEYSVIKIVLIIHVPYVYHLLFTYINTTKIPCFGIPRSQVAEQLELGCFSTRSNIYADYSTKHDKSKDEPSEYERMRYTDALVKW